MADKIKITGISISLIEIYAAKRFGGKAIPANRPKTWKYPLITIHTNLGINGYTMAYGPHGDGQAISLIIMEVYYREIIGENPLNTEYLWQKLRTKIRHFYHQNESILGVLDVAFWDIKGKYYKSSIADLLGRYRSKIKTYATSRVYLPTPEEVYEEALTIKESKSHGYKLQLWQGPNLDIPRFYAAREAVGPEFHLMQDASGGYTYVQALEVGKVLDELNYKWFEEPIPDRQRGLLKRLDRELKTPLLLGETLSLAEMADFIVNNSCGMIRGDVLIKAGITGLQKAFNFCDLLGINLEIHTAGTPLLDVANLQVACANKNCDYIELHHSIFRFGLKNSPLLEDHEGFVNLPEKPGLGIELDWDWIDKHTIEKTNKNI